MSFSCPNGFSRSPLRSDMSEERGSLLSTAVGYCFLQSPDGLIIKAGDSLSQESIRKIQKCI